MTSDRTYRGLAAMPAQERSLPVDGRGHGGEASSAMARSASPQGPSQGSGQGTGQGPGRKAKKPSKPGSSPHADVQSGHWDDAGWNRDHDEAAGHRARRLLSRSNSRLHRMGDKLAA